MQTKVRRGSRGWRGWALNWILAGVWMAAAASARAQVGTNLPPTFPPSSYEVFIENVGAPYLEGQFMFTILVRPTPLVPITVRATAVNREGRPVAARDCFLSALPHSTIYPFSLEHPELVHGGSLILSAASTNSVAVSFPAGVSLPIPPKAELFFDSETAIVDDGFTATVEVGMSRNILAPSTFYLEERAVNDPLNVIRSALYAMPAGQARTTIFWTGAQPGRFLTIRGVEAAVNEQRNSARFTFPPSIVGFTVATMNAGAGERVQATVVRFGPPVSGMTVDYEIVKETANEAHIVMTNGIIRFEELQREAIIEVQTIASADAVYKTFRIRLRNAVGGVVGGGRQELRVTLANTVRFDQPNYTITADERLRGRVRTLAPMLEDQFVELQLPNGTRNLYIPAGESEAAFDIWFPLQHAASIRLSAGGELHYDAEPTLVMAPGYERDYTLWTLEDATVKEGETVSLTLQSVFAVSKEREFIARWSGSAAAGVDYEPIVTSARLTPTNNAASISLRALPREGVQPARKVQVDIAPAGEPERIVARATVTIQEPSIFALESELGVEGERPAAVTVRFTGPPQRFRYFTRDLEAKAGADYVAVSGEVLNAAAETRIEIPIIDDGLPEPEEPFELTVESLDVPGISATLRLPIYDNEKPLPLQMTNLNLDLYSHTGILRPDGTVLLISYDGACYSLDAQRRVTPIRTEAQLFFTSLALNTVTKLSTGEHLVAEVGQSSTTQLRRIKPDGLLDPLYQIPLEIGWLSSMAVDSQDRVYVSAYTPSGRAMVARLAPDGSIDRTFTPFFDDDASPGRLWLKGDVLEVQFHHGSMGGRSAGPRHMGWGGWTVYHQFNRENGTLISTLKTSTLESRLFTLEDGSTLVRSESRTHRVNGDGSIRSDFVAPFLEDRVLGVRDGKVIGFHWGAYFELPLVTDLQATAYETGYLALTENMGTNWMWVLRYGNTSGEARLRISTADETAVQGRDYALPNEWVTFAPLASEARLAARAIDNFASDGERRFTINLLNETTETVEARAKVTIYDDDPIIRFEIRKTSAPGWYQVLFHNSGSYIATIQTAPTINGPWTTYEVARGPISMGIEFTLDAPQKFWRAIVPTP